MLPRDLYRTDPDAIRAMLEARHTDAPLDRLLDVDRQWRDLVVRLEELRAQRNAGSKEVGALFREGRKEEGEAKRAEMGVLGDEIKDLEDRAGALEGELQKLELTIPNIVDVSVPVGVDESDNRVERSWGEIRQFGFEPQAHWDLGPSLGIIDFERGAKIAGARFAVLSGVGATLERALMNYMIDLQTRVNGYTDVVPPFMVNSTSLIGTGQLPKFGEDLFHIDGTDYSLIPTAEVPLTNLHRDETLDEAALPLRYCAATPCFRAEAGSYGKDVRGLVRLHQFHKVELVEIATPETSSDRLEILTGHAEAVLQGLGLPYRVVTLCTGDLGFSANEDLRSRGLVAGTRDLPRDLLLFEFRRLSGAASDRSATDRPRAVSPVWSIPSTVPDWRWAAPWWRCSKTTSSGTARWLCPRCCGPTCTASRSSNPPFALGNSEPEPQPEPVDVTVIGFLTPGYSSPRWPLPAPRVRFDGRFTALRNPSTMYSLQDPGWPSRIPRRLVSPVNDNGNGLGLGEETDTAGNSSPRG